MDDSPFSCSQEPATGPSPQADQLFYNFHPISLNSIKCYHSNYAWVFQVDSSIQGPDQNFVCIFHQSHMWYMHHSLCIFQIEHH